MTPETLVFIVETQTPQGTVHVVTCVPPEVVMKHGLASHAVIGQLSRPARAGRVHHARQLCPQLPVVEFLHEFLAANAPEEPACRAEAGRVGEGWIYVIDQRTETPDGEVPPYDIIGALQVAAGTVVPKSYRRNENHRILSERGFLRLSPWLHERLVEGMSSKG